MLFDLRPKTGKRELYGRKEELKRLASAFGSDVPIILLLGMRRIGKTSLLGTALTESDVPSIYVDARRLNEEGYTRSVLYGIFSEEISSLSSKRSRLRDALRHVKGIHLGGAVIELDWGKEGVSLSSLLGSLDRWAAKAAGVRNVVVAIDEAQLLRNMTGGKGRIDFRSLIAYCYDNLKRIKFVLAGSEVGLLMDFVGLEDPDSPLYGRGSMEMALERFSREKALRFLEAGFREYGMKYEKETLGSVVDKLDGIIGWLTLYGSKVVEKGKSDRTLLASVLELAKGMVKSEVEPILTRSRYYRLALRSLGNGASHWSEVKKSMISLTGRFVTDAQVSRTLDTLARLGIVSKEKDEYMIPDPILKELAREL